MIQTAATQTMNPKIINFLTLAARGFLFLLFAVMLLAALHPEVRSSMRTTLVKDFRMVVSTAHGDLTGSGVALTVAKVKTRDALFIEVYEPRSDGGQHLVERIELADKRDGYFNFNGQATNLAIDDIDGDGRPEILVPTFDHNLVGRLNIYRYNAGSRIFQRSLR